MQIRVYATLRELMGQARLNVPIVGASTVGDVLETLVAAHPMLDGKLWDADRNLTGFVTVLLNGRSIEYLQGLGTAVSDSDTMALFPPVGGGSARELEPAAQRELEIVVRELTLRGIGVPVVAMYVEDLGGRQANARPGDTVYAGPGWRIELSEGEKVRIGSLQVGVTMVRIAGPETIVEEVEAALTKKVLRAGG